MGRVETGKIKLSLLLYSTLPNSPGSNNNIIEIFANEIGINFVTLEFLNILPDLSLVSTMLEISPRSV